MQLTASASVEAIKARYKELVKRHHPDANGGDRSSEEMLNLCDQEEIVFIPWAPVQNHDENVGVRAAAERLGATPHTVVLAWLLSRSRHVLPIPGTGSPEHVTENVAAAALELTGREEAAITEGGA